MFFMHLHILLITIYSTYFLCALLLLLDLSSYSSWWFDLLITCYVFLTSESSWEKPADFPSNDASGSGSNREEESQEEPSTPQPEPLSGEDESSNGAQATQEAEVPEQASQQPKVPKISFRVRRVLVAHEC